MRIYDCDCLYDYYPNYLFNLMYKNSCSNKPGSLFVDAKMTTTYTEKDDSDEDVTK